MLLRIIDCNFVHEFTVMQYQIANKIKISAPLRLCASALKNSASLRLCVSALKNSASRRLDVAVGEVVVEVPVEGGEGVLACLDVVPDFAFAV